MSRHVTLVLVTILLLPACAKSSSSPSAPVAPTTPVPPTASFTATFDQNPVPFRSTGCSFSTPQGWYTPARVQESAGVAFTPATLTQKLDGSTDGALVESFPSRFGACSGAAFTPGVIAANGAVCGIVGVCTSDAHTTYQFSIAGTDANGHALTFDSPVLQLGARPAGQLTSRAGSSVAPVAPAPSRSGR